MDREAFRSRFEAEGRRLQLNMLRLPGLAGCGFGWDETLLAHMRVLSPGCTWADVFPGVRIPEPPPELHAQVAAADADPEAYWRVAEAQSALWQEAERVLSAEWARAQRDGVAFGMSYPYGPEHALRVLRGLPDGAGWEAVEAALASAPPE